MIGTDFMDVSSDTENGEEVIIPPAERVLGTLQSRGSVEFADDFAMTDEELLLS